MHPYGCCCSIDFISRFLCSFYHFCIDKNKTHDDNHFKRFDHFVSVFYSFHLQLGCRFWDYSCGVVRINVASFAMTNHWSIHSMIQPSRAGCSISSDWFYPADWWVIIRIIWIKIYIYIHPNPQSQYRPYSIYSIRFFVFIVFMFGFSGFLKNLTEIVWRSLSNQSRFDFINGSCTCCAVFAQNELD